MWVGEHIGMCMILIHLTLHEIYKYTYIINKNLIGIKKDFQIINFNKLIYINISILELLKIHINLFCYNILKPKY